MHPKDYLEKFFALKERKITDSTRSSFEEFCSQEKYLNAVTQILAQQEMLMKDWTLKLRIEDIVKQQVLIPNGTVGKPYAALLDFDKLQWQDIIAWEIEGLEETGLLLDKEAKKIEGIPVVSGDFKIRLKFRVAGEEDKEDENLKLISLIINPDPKSLWKNIASDDKQIFWKKDNVTDFYELETKSLLVSSKRGRSHANVGSFRDDDYACRYFPSSGWSVIAVSDGAGSARYSREGSRIACNSVIDYFKEKFDRNAFAELDTLLIRQQEAGNEEARKAINIFLYNNLGGAAKNAYNQILEKSKETESDIRDYHATLIFTLFKRYDFGFVILSFGVGDCPIGLLYNNCSAVSLMNTMDVGEFGGGTRFITMPEIFQADQFSGRMGFKIVPDFDFLILMTDGIYDPKFEVEANLVKAEKWTAFIEDLKGNNAESNKVTLEKDNAVITAELDKWMDFWSSGNHDDRTLAIVF